MKKIRIGNDFVFSWAIERGGVPENLETVLEKHLYMIVFGQKTEIHNYTVSGNNIIVEFTPELLNKIGIYTLIFYYVLPDTSLSDDDRKCTVDIDAFQIVPRTAMADDVSEFAVTSDMAIAFKGEKGDSAYQVWLDEGNVGTIDDYLEWLRQPAIDAGNAVQEQTNLFISEKEEEIDNVVGEIAYNESKRLEAEALRVSAESTRVENENARIEAESERNTAEAARQENTTIAIQNANEAASNANEARLAIEGDLTAINENIWQLSNGVIDDEEVIATDLNELAARVSALEAAFRNMIISKMQVDSIDVLKDLNYQGRPIFIVSNVAPNIVPDGVPQFWINTATGDFYSAKNNTSVNDWILI
jgi:hypothetical protein